MRAWLDNPEASHKPANTLKLNQVTDSYDACFVVGGHGVMWDLPDNKELQALLARTYQSGKVVAAVSHGPAALVNVQLDDGSYLVAGKRVAAFTNQEEDAAGLSTVMPFALETKLNARGARHQSAPMWQAHAVADGRLVTGQNPSSSVEVARLTLAAIKHQQEAAGSTTPAQAV